MQNSHDERSETCPEILWQGQSLGATSLSFQLLDVKPSDRDLPTFPSFFSNESGRRGIVDFSPNPAPFEPMCEGLHLRVVQPSYCLRVLLAEILFAETQQ